MGTFGACDNKCLKMFKVTKPQSGVLGKHCQHQDSFKVKCEEGVDKPILPAALKFCRGEL